MNQPSTAPRTRQRFSVFLGWLGVIIGVLLAASSRLSWDHRGLLAFGFAFAVASWAVLARPFLSARADALVLSNVIREVHLPWAGISHATSRGSLIVHDNDGGKHTAWAISSQKATAQRDDSPTPSLRPMPGTLREPQTSSRALAEEINAETVDNPTDTPSGRTVRILPVPAGLLALACIGLLIGFL